MHGTASSFSRRRHIFVRVAFVLLVLRFTSTVQAQTAPESGPEIILREALVAPAAPGHFDLVGTRDPVIYSLVKGSWRNPVEGDKVMLRDSLLGRWESAAADSAGWFRHAALRRGYAVLTYESPRDTAVVLHARAHSLLFVNGTPRSSNQYEMQDEYPTWAPQFNYPLIPIELKKGRNTLVFLCARGMLKVGLAVVRRTRPSTTRIERRGDLELQEDLGDLATMNEEQDAVVFFNPRDLTVPDLLTGMTSSGWGAVIVVNRSQTPLRGAVIIADAPDGSEPEQTPIPDIPPMALRKVPFRFSVRAPVGTGSFKLRLEVWSSTIPYPSKPGTWTRFDSCTVSLKVVAPGAPRRETFISNIDGSVQYYAVNPASAQGPTAPALLFSLHGASVEAIGHASAYSSKPWMNIVAPTNRRPYGFSWEDWGRLDALEVFDIAMRRYAPDPARVYLSGHSMGGHGTWQIGLNYPDRWAAIGPSAGWISFRSYRHNNPPLSRTPMGLMLQRAALPSDTYFMAQNARRFGSYVLHGSADDDVSVEEARAMVRVLDSLKMDYVYTEIPGAGHWWDESPEPGSDCLDWAPMMDFFARHARPEKKRVRTVEFVTASPAISSRCDWAELLSQDTAWMPSRVMLRVDPKLGLFSGTTENLHRLALDLAQLERSDSVSFLLDGQRVGPIALDAGMERAFLEKGSGTWRIAGAPALSEKGPHRGGPFKDAFRHRMILVYGTKGNADENRWAFEKAKADAEQFWYQGNGAVDLASDAEFVPADHPGRNVILYGNASTHGDWQELLGAAPVRVQRGELSVGNKRIRDAELCCLFLQPRPGSDSCCVGAVSGTGPVGMRITNRLAYLSAGIAFPDLFVATPELLLDGESGVVCSGFFGNDWSAARGEFIWQEK